MQKPKTRSHSVTAKVTLLLALSALGTPAWAFSPRDIYQKSGAAVVLILGTDDGHNGSGGTGSIISADGKIITNGHVVLNARGVPFQKIFVWLKPAKITGDNNVDLKNRLSARVKAYSPGGELDLALLQIEEPPAGLPVVEFGDPDDVNIGDPVVAIGHPEQGGLWTLTTGTISTVIQNFDRVKGKHVFQTEASFNRGNSGGPLFDESGHMIGINTMIARKAADGLAITAVNFSLKSSVAMNWLKGQQTMLAYAPGAATRGAALAQNAAPSAPLASNEKATKNAVEQDGAPRVAEAQATSGVSDKSKRPEAKVPTIVTPKRPYNLDRLIADQMKEMEDMMGEMHEKVMQRRGGR